MDEVSAMFLWNITWKKSREHNGDYTVWNLERTLLSVIRPGCFSTTHTRGFDNPRSFLKALYYTNRQISDTIVLAQEKIMPEDNIVDASKPSAGRMYDYFLGGNHNFEVDRQAADELLRMFPFFPKYMRLQRWALQDIAVELSEKRGYDVIIDFASGLPTQDHIHYKVKKGTTVIYSDYDPIVVEYTRDILKDTRDVYFFQSDARRPEELLNRAEVVKILAGRKKVAFVMWGIALFLEDEDIRHATKTLYDWADPGSCLAFNTMAANINLQDPDIIKAEKMYREIGTPIHYRTTDLYSELVKPWKLDEQGWIDLLSWHGFDQSELGDKGSMTFGPMGGGFGAYLSK